jgi:hypothetical protein
VRRRDLLVAIAEIEPVRVQGRFERHVSLRWNELIGSAAGGRWGASRAFEVLYLGRPRESVVVEAYRHLVDDELDDAGGLAASVVERRLLTCQVNIGNILDLRDVAVQKAVGLSVGDLRSPVGDWGRCQAVGAAAHQLGLAGVLAPAATALGETLALFTEKVPASQWPEIVAREIWHGLPADPRKLRAVEGDAG